MQSARQIAYLHAIGIDVWRRRKSRAEVAAESIRSSTAVPAFTAATSGTAPGAPPTPPPLPTPPADRDAGIRTPTRFEERAGMRFEERAGKRFEERAGMRFEERAGMRFEVRAEQYGGGLALIDAADAESASVRRFVGDLFATLGVDAGAPARAGEFIWPPRGNPHLGGEPETARAVLTTWIERQIVDRSPQAIVLGGAAAATVREGEPFACDMRNGIRSIAITDLPRVAVSVQHKRDLWRLLRALA